MEKFFLIKSESILELPILQVMLTVETNKMISTRLIMKEPAELEKKSISEADTTKILLKLNRKTVVTKFTQAVIRGALTL